MRNPGERHEFRVVAVLIPAFGEGERLPQTLHGLAAVAKANAQTIDARHVVLVDDGSTPPIDVGPCLAAAQGKVTLHTMRHPVNIGQGAALQTALHYARTHLVADAYVTMDADGQHDPETIVQFLKALDDFQMAFGSRFLEAEHRALIPVARRRLLVVATWFERWMTGLRLSDAHNGFRAFRHEVATAIELQQAKMAHASEFKQIVKQRRFQFCEVPTPIRYTDDTVGKGQRATGSFEILRDLFRGYFFEG